MSGYLREGKWIIDSAWESDSEGNFERQASTFRERPQTAEPGRYRLYVSHACPWCHRTTMARALLQLQPTLPMTVVSPYMGEDGWAFRDKHQTPTPEPELGATLLRELYLASDQRYTGRVTVPILWDREEQRIVNNESRDILYILCDAFAALSPVSLDLYPRDRRAAVDEAIDAIYEPINNGVYRCGFARTQMAYDDAVATLFESLSFWNEELGARRFICGDVMTLADLCMFATLIRFDAVYHTHFKCDWSYIFDYSALRDYVCDIAQTPGISATCDFQHIREHYFRSHPELNPSGIIPIGTDLSWLGRAHGRAGMTRELQSSLPQ